VKYPVDKNGIMMTCGKMKATNCMYDVSDFHAPSVLLASLPLDCACTCVAIGGVMYSNFRESRVNVTGPSLVKLTFIIAPNFPSVKLAGATLFGRTGGRI
jgi:hypothetical protein